MNDLIGYTVIEYNQASGQPEFPGSIGTLTDRATAEAIAYDHRVEAATAGRRETYAVAEVVSVEAAS